MDSIIIKNFRVKTLIGINAEEKKVEQEIILNIRLKFNFKKAVKSDNIPDTVNYSTLTKRIINFVENSKFNLIETLADKIANLCLEEELVESLC